MKEVCRFLCGAALVTSCALYFAPFPLSAQKKQIETAPAKQTSPESGEEMYKSYCAVCHGVDGKGKGPAASEHKTPVPDLTMLAKRNGGKFPSGKVKTVLLNGVDEPAHGTADMPVWGPVFSALNQSQSSIVALRIANLNRYLESMQAK